MKSQKPNFSSIRREVLAKLESLFLDKYKRGFFFDQEQLEYLIHAVNSEILFYPDEEDESGERKTFDVDEEDLGVPF